MEALALVTDAQREDALRRLVQRIDPGSRLLRAWPLTGGVSAQTTALDVAQPDGTTTKLIVRRHGDADRERNPHIARDEFKLLQIVQTHGLTAPKPYYLDESCGLLPTPFLVIGYVVGDTEFAPPDLPDHLAQAAAALAKIHGVPSSSELSFLPRQDRAFAERPLNLDTSLGEGRIRDALEAAWPWPQVNESVLLHGDYWPGNILWNSGRLAAVIDWEDASVGDPLADLANSRLEILWAFGIAAMTEFTAAYRSMTRVDVAALPCWDLCAALRPCSRLSEWGLNRATERRLRERHQRFVAQALENLSVR